MPESASPVQPYPKFASVAVLRTTMSGAARALWRPRLVGEEFFPGTGPCFVYGNHSNRWDPFIINVFTRWLNPTAGVMTREYFRGDFLARAFGSIGLVPASKRLAEPGLVRRVLELLQHDRSVVIYPEGGSRWDGRPMPWMAATVKLFVRAGVPIHPILVHGSYWSWPRWADYPRPAQVVVEARPPIVFSRDTTVEEATAQLRAVTDFDETVNLSSEQPVLAFHPAKGIRRLLYRDPWQDSGAMSSVDGRIVRVGASDRRLRMLPDSSLTDLSTGVTYTTAELYERVRQLPLHPLTGGALLEDEVVIHEEPEFPSLIGHGPALVRLFADRIEISEPLKRVVPLDDIVYYDIERNYKLQLYLRTGPAMLQLSFTGLGSALQWKDTLERVSPSTTKTS